MNRDQLQEEGSKTKDICPSLNLGGVLAAGLLAPHNSAVNKHSNTLPSTVKWPLNIPPTTTSESRMHF
jgi:hypothetical protein